MGKPPRASAITRTKKTQIASTQRYGDGIVTPRISKPMLMLMLCGSSGRSAFSCLAQYRHHAEVNASGGDVLLLRSRYSTPGTTNSCLRAVFTAKWFFF